MDNVLRYDVVLGNGTSVSVDRMSNPDLFWALKGGSNNFGIVTKFVLKTLKVPQVSTTIQQFDESAVEDFIAATVDLANDDDPSLAAGAIISISYNATTKAVSPSLLGVQEGTQSPPGRFSNFSAIEPVLREDDVMAPTAWHSTLDSPFQMFRVQFGHHSMKPDAQQLNKLYSIWKAAVEEISDVEGLYPTFVMNTLPKSAARAAKDNGVGNVWGLDDSQSLILWQLSTAWANKQDDLRVQNWVKSLVEYLHSLNKAEGLSSEFLYMGDAGEFQNPFNGFPLENVQRMREIRRAYDPDGVFTRLNVIDLEVGQTRKSDRISDSLSRI